MHMCIFIERKLVTFSCSASIIPLHKYFTMDSSLSSFEIASMICGYHKYTVIWEGPISSKSFVCEHEVGNSHDPLSVAVKKTISDESTIFGYVSRRISPLCSIFLDEEEASII